LSKFRSLRQIIGENISLHRGNPETPLERDLNLVLHLHSTSWAFDQRAGSSLGQISSSREFTMTKTKFNRRSFSNSTRIISALVFLGIAAFNYLTSHHIIPGASSSISPGTMTGANPDASLITRGFVQNPRMTPGDVLTTDRKQICTPGYTKTVRNVPSSLKHQIYQAYGIPTHKSGDYEIDHLISLELGGSNSVRNLWPESFKSMPLNAHVKDDVENKLHEMICNGRIDVAQAQREIANDWTVAYTKYVGPLPR
jgi:hypothetical protein